MNTLTSVLSIAPPLVLQTVLLWVLIRRQAFRTFPWFFAYTLFSVIANVGRFAVASHFDIYFDLYWVTEAAYAIMAAISAPAQCLASIARKATLGRSAHIA